MDSIGSIRRSLGDRLKIVRIERFGEGDEGLAAIAGAIGVEAGTWENYETGVVVPAEMVLKLMLLTRVNSQWLATGEGPRYSRTDPGLRFMPLN